MSRARPQTHSRGNHKGHPRSDRDDKRPTSRPGEVWLYGYHACAAALANPERKILRVAATTEIVARLSQDSTISQRLLSQIRPVGRREIDALVGENSVHQGIAVLARTLDNDLASILERITAPDACVLVLDQVTDPHNVGAVLRSAAAFGAAAVLAPDRHAPDETGAMAKSASGALDKIPYVKTTNLVRGIELLKQFEFWIVGLAADASTTLVETKLTGRIALALGAEDEGLRRLVRESCDQLARLPMADGMESLNVSNAAAVALYEKARQTGIK